MTILGMVIVWVLASISGTCLAFVLLKGGGVEEAPESNIDPEQARRCVAGVAKFDRGARDD